MCVQKAEEWRIAMGAASFYGRRQTWGPSGSGHKTSRILSPTQFDFAPSRLPFFSRHVADVAPARTINPAKTRTTVSLTAIFTHAVDRNPLCYVTFIAS